MFLGRNPEQLRRSLGDQAAGSNPQIVETSTNPSGFGDQIVKDLAGQWVSDLLGDSLRKLIELDVLRFEVGFGSIGFTAKKRLLENLTIGGEVEQTTIGRTFNLTGEIKTPFHPLRRVTSDRFTVEGGFLGKYYNDPADLDIQDLQGRFVYHLIIP